MDSGTIVRGGTVVTPAGTRKLDIVIVGGRIVALAEHAPSGSGADEIDATGLIVLPGGVDGHSHFILSDPATMVPDLEEFEGMVNGGSAAVAGGITTCVEMARVFQYARTSGSEDAEPTKTPGTSRTANRGGIHIKPANAASSGTS